MAGVAAATVAIATFAMASTSSSGVVDPSSLALLTADDSAAAAPPSSATPPTTTTLPADLEDRISGLASVAATPFDLRAGLDPTTTTTEAPTTTTEAPTTTTTAAPTTTTAPPPPPPPPTTAPPPPPPTTTTAPPPPPEPAYGDPYDPATWDRLAGCESGGDWHINTGNGYYGGLQFSLQSWQGVGGSGYPHEHPRDTQIQMGIRLWEAQGWGAWPSCSRQLGYR